ncbi:archaeal ribosomal protein S17P [Batrachochytrium salamandrivorans]|nr:archaeal ribosomal protein S17P [Batrachochytrium salamandrivorans]
MEESKSFQQQEKVFCGAKKLVQKTGKVTLPRYYRNIGLGFKTPQAAIDGTYVDHKCPFTGNVSIRGRILKGICASTKMQRSIIVRRDYVHYVRKYKRYEKRHHNIAAHASPAFVIKEGDVITIGECRPLSKTIRFNVIEVEASGKGEDAKKQFRMF